MRFEIKPSDRLHMLVWKPRKSADWCAVRAVNSLPLDYARHFPTWREALDYALNQVAEVRP